MKIARLEHAGGVRVGIVDGSNVAILAGEVDVVDLLVADPQERERIATRVTGEEPLAEVRLLAPVVPPTIRDFSVFEQHVAGIVKLRDPSAQVPEEWYEAPAAYFTNTHALTGPGDAIAVPPGCRQLDLELEVAAVIGRAGHNVSAEDAGEHIAGYTIFNDWSARDVQIAEMRLHLGPFKGKDFANTLGPWIVTADELEDHRRDERLDLQMRAEINGEQLGADTLANMAWSFEELVAYASRGTWVRTGDVIGSGTCGSGCLLELWGRHGLDHHPPLAPGDTVSLHVEHIGTLTNTVVAGTGASPLPPARRRQG